MPHDDDDHHQEEEQQRPRLRRTKTIAGDEDVQELALGAEGGLPMAGGWLLFLGILIAGGNNPFVTRSD